MDFTPEDIFGFIQSDDPFPVDFDDIWESIGYARKDSAVESLKLNCLEGVDFNFQEVPEVRIEGRRKVTRYIKKYFLSFDGWKLFATSAGTRIGREIRLYLIYCEKELRRRIQKEQESKRDRVLKAVVSDEYTRWTKKFEDNFFEEAYRITGWEKTSKGHPPCMGRFVNENVYDHFPEGTTSRLQHVNPKVNGRRKRKHHQHLTKDVGFPLLDYQKGLTMATMRLSPSNNPKQFKSNMQKVCGDHFQIELLDEAL